MNRLILVLLFAACTVAAQDKMALGANLFRQTCTVGYCHGQGGAAGRAPRLAGRNLDHDYLTRVTRDGIPNTGMPGWKDRFKAAEFDALMAFVLTINGPSGAAPAASATVSKPEAEMPEAARKGKDLFFDATRGVSRCGSCHALEGWGTAVGPNLAQGKRTAAELRNGRGGVRMLRTAEGETFPAWKVDEQGVWLRVFDLTSAPPVLRTVAAKSVSWQEASPWRHSTAASRYTDAELAAIGEYLDWLAK